MNTDYKIIAKVVSKRLKMALIDDDQVGYLEGRFCGENIRLISDIITDYCKYHKIASVILLADFEKAFYTVKWKFLKSVLKRNFGSL